MTVRTLVELKHVCTFFKFRSIKFFYGCVEGIAVDMYNVLGQISACFKDSNLHKKEWLGPVAPGVYGTSNESETTTHLLINSPQIRSQVQRLQLLLLLQDGFNPLRKLCIL